MRARRAQRQRRGQRWRRETKEAAQGQGPQRTVVGEAVLVLEHAPGVHQPLRIRGNPRGLCKALAELSNAILVGGGGGGGGGVCLS